MNRAKRIAQLRIRITDQRKWIEGCESNGVSYADGERGQAIRTADANQLNALQTEFEMLTGARA